VVIVQDQWQGGGDCASSARDRSVARLFTETLGRLPGEATLADLSAKSGTVAGRRSAAAPILASAEARKRFIDAEYVRITGARPTVGSRDLWLTRLRAGRQPRALRAALYGTPAFRIRIGASTEAFVAGIYAAEQAGAVPQAALDLARQRTAAGATREQIAAELLGRTELVDAFVTRTFRIWWGRAPTAAERTTWRNRFAAGPEMAVLADLIAATPLR
ncbi:MAG TPA: hypothetical protein VHK88_03590, partial [Aquihabitans sp.]|nr:hypothetical protein [Aquihabitans sp.]